MSKKCKFSDLCANCTHEAGCGYKAKHTRPILFCEEFEYIKGEETMRALKQKLNRFEEDSNKYNGLCRNCENRDICLPKKVKSNVIHCNDYK